MGGGGGGFLIGYTAVRALPGEHRWRSWERQLRFVAVWGAFVALALFYIIPITAVQGLINVRALPSCPCCNTSLQPMYLLSLFQRHFGGCLGAVAIHQCCQYHIWVGGGGVAARIIVANATVRGLTWGRRQHISVAYAVQRVCRVSDAQP